MISAGEFWIADIPFTDQTSSKMRPVLVLTVSYPSRSRFAIACAFYRARRGVPQLLRAAK